MLMSFKLRVMLEGLCVFFPNEGMPETEVVFVITPAGKTTAHSCQMTATRHDASKSTIKFPNLLTQHDIFFFDGASEVGSGSTGASHSFDTLPKLAQTFNPQPPIPKPGVRRGAAFGGGGTLWSARLVIRGGEISENDQSYHLWQIHDGTKFIGHPSKMLGTLVHEHPIDADSVQVVTWDGTTLESGARNLVVSELYPIGDYVDLLIVNHSHMELDLLAGCVNSAPHFPFAFNLFDKAPNPVPTLRQPPNCSPPSQVHLQSKLSVPCVGGCTC